MQHLQMEETAVNIANHYSIIRDRSSDLYVGIDMVKIIQMGWQPVARCNAWLRHQGHLPEREHSTGRGTGPAAYKGSDTIRK